MFDKDEFIDRIEDLSPEEIAEAIRNGSIREREINLAAGGRFNPSKQKAVRDILNGTPTEEPTVTPPEVPIDSPQSEEIEEPEEEVEEPEPAPNADADKKHTPSPRSAASEAAPIGWDGERVFNSSAEELAEAIRRGEVTFDLLKERFGPDFPHSKRKQVIYLLSRSDEDDYKQAKREGTSEAFRSYLKGHPDGVHCAEAKQMIEWLSLERAWEELDKMDIHAVRQFVRDHPDSPHVGEAEEIIQRDQERRRRSRHEPNPTRAVKELNDSLEQLGEDYVNSVIDHFQTSGLTNDDLVNEIAKDHNILRAQNVKLLIDEGIISGDDLINAGIDESVVRLIEEAQPGKLEPTSIYIRSAGPTSLAIGRACTEVYIWGIPSTGKTCAIGAILHAMLSEGSEDFTASLISNDNNKSGYDYASQLRSAFNPAVHDAEGLVKLVQGTALNEFFKIEFDLVSPPTGKAHKRYPFTMMDMAGELMTAIHRRMTDKQTKEDEKMLSQLDLMLGTGSNKRHSNRRIHIFCLEYGGENRSDSSNDVQGYLSSVAEFLDKKGYLKNDTDAICMLVTKVDCAPAGTNFGAYVKANYRNFTNFLKGQCERYEINKGTIPVLVFSLGQVYFKTLCKRDSSYAQDFIHKILLEFGTPVDEGGIVNKVTGILRS